MDESDILDLDALAPKPVKVKFEGQLIEIKPPTMEHMLKIGAYFSNIKQPEAQDKEGFAKIVSGIVTLIGEVIPTIDASKLNPFQMKALIEIINKMAQPKVPEGTPNIELDIPKKAPPE